MTQREQLGAALRDFEGAKARVERDARQVADDMRKQLVAQLLPVMDNLDRTIQSATAHGDAPAAVEGVGLVRTQLEAVLRGYGAVRIEAVGASFDPTVHEAVTTRPVPTAAMHDQVVEQLAPGYRFGAHLLRPAQVVVGKQAPAPIAEPPESRAVSAAAPDDRAARDDRDAPEDRDERVAEARADDALADDARADDARANEAQVREAQVREAQVREAQVREARRRAAFDPEADRAPRPRYVDAYGRPVDAYGRPVDAYGRPLRFDAYGRPIHPAAAASPFARRFR